jgi:hypothetical protein
MTIENVYYTSRHRFPTTLPGRDDWVPKGTSTRARFGLLQQFGDRKSLPRECPFRTELKRFDAWCLEPLNLAEGGKRGIAQSTYRSYKNSVSKFLGFSYSLLHVPLHLTSIRLVTNQVRFLNVFYVVRLHT